VERDDDTKAGRKVSAASAAHDKTAFEETAFGRRRVSKVPKVLMTLGTLIALPVLFVYRRFWHSGGQ
jgi:hypothetical protein